MKYLVFFIALAFGVPIGYQLALKNKKIENLIFFLAIFFTVENISINFISREWLRGTSRGIEISMVDLAAMILFFLVLNRKKQYPLKLFPPGSFLYFLYVGFSFISIFNASMPLMSVFELWKMLKMYGYYWILYHYFVEEKQFKVFMKFVAILIIYISIIVLKQKYIEGMFQCYGPFDHQNSLVMYLIVFNSLAFSYLLNSKDTSTFFWLIVLGLGAVSIVSSLSRAGLALFGFSCIIILLLSYGNGISPKKIGVTFLIILGGIGLLLKAMDSITERFESAPEASKNTRIFLAVAAKKMAEDKTFGIGLNNFGQAIKMDRYNSHIEVEERPDDPDYVPMQYILVETIYMMIAAETGWHNLVIFLLFIWLFYFRNLFNIRAFKNSTVQFVAIGLAGGLLAIYLESALEWVLKQVNNMYQMFMVFALISSMSRINKTQKGLA